MKYFNLRFLKVILAISVLFAFQATGAASDASKSKFKPQTLTQFLAKMNGESRFRKLGPEAYVDNQTRRIPGRVVLVNFAMLEELGVTGAEDHKITPELEEAFLNAFSRRIILEDDVLESANDEIKALYTPPKDAKLMPGLYMATRYKNEDGVKGGDGRAMWNGQVDLLDPNGRVIGTLDVLSKGTGSTPLRRFSINADSYGDGLAMMDEFFHSYLQSEIYHRNGLTTERYLCIIDIGDGLGIGVRVGQPLLRPSHLLYWEEKGDARMARRTLDYAIELERLNQRGAGLEPGPDLYERWLKRQAQLLGEFAARNQSLFIYHLGSGWNNSGDNMIFPAGFLDYGATFNASMPFLDYRHGNGAGKKPDENFWQQKTIMKRLLAQYIKTVELIHSGTKSPWQIRYDDYSLFNDFENAFSRKKAQMLLIQLGFSSIQTEFILHQKYQQISKLVDLVTYFIKIRRKRNVVFDAAEGERFRPAVYDIRALFRNLPDALLKSRDQGRSVNLSGVKFVQLMKSQWSRKMDLQEDVARDRRADTFQNLYRELVDVASFGLSGTAWSDQLMLMSERAQNTNRVDRLNGNSAVLIGDRIAKLIAEHKVNPSVLYESLQPLIAEGIENPDLMVTYSEPRKGTRCAELLGGYRKTARENRQEF